MVKVEKKGRPSFLQVTTLHSHNSTHTTLHGPFLHTHNSIRHNSTRHNSTRNNSTHHNSIRQNLTPRVKKTSLGSDPMHDSQRDSLRDSFFYAGRHDSTRQNPTSNNLLRHNSTRHNSTRHDPTQLQLDTKQFYTTTTGHGITLHDHNSTRHNSTRPQLGMSQLYTDHMAVRLSLL